MNLINQINKLILQIMQKFYLLLSLILILTASCSEFSKIQKSDSITQKLEAGIKYYKSKDYYKAATLLDEVVPLLKGKAEAEDAQYYQAMTYYDDKQYVMSAYYFKDFFETYPRSARAEECSFLHAKSLYKDSPRHDLDQTVTEEAIQAFQSFLTRYPQSTFLDEVNKLTDELNKKIEFKEYENAKLFFNIKNYKSAVVVFNNFLDKYPESEYGDEIAYNRIMAQFHLAKFSVEGLKKKNRFLDTIEFYQSFIDKYPNSRYKKAAESIYDICNRFISFQVKA